MEMIEPYCTIDALHLLASKNSTRRCTNNQDHDGSRKRSREEDVDDCVMLLEDETIPMGRLGGNNSYPMTPLSYIVQLDNTVSAACAVHDLQSLAHRLEKCSDNAHLFLPLYHSFCDNMHSAVTSIHSQMVVSNVNLSEQRNDIEIQHDHQQLTQQKKRHLLDQLYKEAIEHVHVLLLDAKLMQEKRIMSHTLCPTNTGACSQSSCSSSSSSVVTPLSSDSSSQDILTTDEQQQGYLAGGNHYIIDNSNNHECVKKQIAGYMTNWLRVNWINPYPDDAGLSEMAKACGTNKTVINNWLINSRTRKWRPAILKAYELGRPTSSLQEDSIHIFDGHPVRELKAVYM